MASDSPVLSPILRRLIIKGGPGSGHFGHEGRPGQRGGSAPSEGTTISEGKAWKPSVAARDMERKMADTFGEAKEWSNACFIGPSGRLLVPGGDHQASAMKVMGGRADDGTPGWMTDAEDALDKVIDTGLIRINSGDDDVAFDIRSEDGVTDNQLSRMAAIVTSIAMQYGHWPSLTMTADGRTRGIFSDDAYRLLGFQDTQSFMPYGGVERGGPGSGHFGHEGRPGERGGSLPSGQAPVAVTFKIRPHAGPIPFDVTKQPVSWEEYDKPRETMPLSAEQQAEYQAQAQTAIDAWGEAIGIYPDGLTITNDTDDFVQNTRWESGVPLSGTELLVYSDQFEDTVLGGFAENKNTIWLQDRLTSPLDRGNLFARDPRWSRTVYHELGHWLDRQYPQELKVAVPRAPTHYTDALSDMGYGYAVRGDSALRKEYVADLVEALATNQATAAGSQLAFARILDPVSHAPMPLTAEDESNLQALMAEVARIQDYRRGRQPEAAPPLRQRAADDAADETYAIVIWPRAHEACIVPLSEAMAQEGEGAIVIRGGPGSGHHGHAGRPGERGGSLPGDATSEGDWSPPSVRYLGDDAAKLPGVPKSVDWHHPESEKPGESFMPLLYHGTVLDHIQDIARDGLLPQVGEWVSEAYARKLEVGEQAVPAVYFAGPTSAEYAEADTRITPADDSYAWKSIMAIEAQVGFLMGKDPENVTLDDIYQNGLMIGVTAEDMREKSMRVVQEDPDTEEVFSRPVSMVGPDDMLIGGEKGTVEKLGPERGDFFTSDKVEPAAYLYGGNLVRWMADWVRRYSDMEAGQYPDDDIAGEYAAKWAGRWESDLMEHDAILDDFPGEPEDIEEESLARRVNAAVERALAGPMPERRIFIPQWLIERGGPGSGHYGHEGRPGERGGSLPGDATAQGEAQDTRVGITGQHSEEKLGARIVPDWQLKKEMEALRGELVDAGVKGVRVEMGRGGYQGGWEQSWVLSYKGVSDAAKRILAETAAKYGQDSFVVFEPPTEGNSHAASNLSLDVDGMDPTVVSNIEARLTEHKFGGWTWSEVDGKPRLQLNVVPALGGDDQKHPAMVAALETDLKELGIRYQRDDWRAAVTAVGPGVKVEYQTYLEGLRGRSLTGYRQGYIMEDQKGVDDGNVEGVGGSGPQGIRSQEVTQGTGEVRRVAEVASEGVAEPGAVGRQPSDFHSQAGLRGGVVISVSRVLRRLVLRGGEGSGHYGHAGIPGQRGGSLPGEGPTKAELQRASTFYDRRKADYHSRFEAMVARQRAIDDKALAHARPQVEGDKGDWSKAIALKLLEGPTYSGNVKALVADFRRFATGTLAWLRKDAASETLRPETLKQAIGTLERMKASLDYWTRVNEPERAMEDIASFVRFELQGFTDSTSVHQGLLSMIDENGNVRLTHPAVVKMMEAGGVREQAITRILGVAQEYNSERSAYLQADLEMRRGTEEVDAFFGRAPEIMADVSPVGTSVAAVTAPRSAMDTALADRETTRLAYGVAVHALTLADQEKMPEDDYYKVAEACDLALDAYQKAQREVMQLNVVGHDEAKDIVNAALLTTNVATLEVLLDASASMQWNAAERERQRWNAVEAQTWLTEHTDASVFPGTGPMLVTVRNTDADVGSRASYAKDQINGKSGMDTATYLHELGHWIEDHNEGVHESAVAFLRSRTAGESYQPLRKVTGDWGYDPWELTRKDEFSSAYVGKIYDSAYTATEIVSMGIQRLYENPSGFQREDPEHFDFTVALLRGLWNKPTP